MIEIENKNELIELIRKVNTISNTAFQNIDFYEFEGLLKDKIFEDCIFLGCNIPASLTNISGDKNMIFPKIDVPFNPYTESLYNPQTLMGGYVIGSPGSYENTLDKKIYNYYISKGEDTNDIKETLAMRLHDHAITDALYDFISKYDERKIVAIMGGHNLPRNNVNYKTIAQISKALTEMDYLMISGGGPGAMEATHLGAWFAGKQDEELHYAIETLSLAPSYKDTLWLDKAFMVIEKYPNPKYESLGVPTWLYGHEPPTPFATRIAKYFENSVREDGLVTIAKGGIIFAPGSAGTIQEIFQDATQNHYLSFGYASPMIFFNSKFWTEDRPIYPLLKNMKEKGIYKNLILSCCNNKNEVIREIVKFTSK